VQLKNGEADQQKQAAKVERVQKKAERESIAAAEAAERE
jgi:hypothetical protein